MALGVLVQNFVMLLGPVDEESTMWGLTQQITTLGAVVYPMPFCRICWISDQYGEHCLPLQFCLHPFLCQVWGLSQRVSVRVTFNVWVTFGRWWRLLCWWWSLRSCNSGCPYCCYCCSVTGSWGGSWGWGGQDCSQSQGAGAVVRIEEAENDPGEASALLDSSIGINPSITPSRGPKGW